MSRFTKWVAALALCLSWPSSLLADLSDIDLIKEVPIGVLAFRSKEQTLAEWQPTAEYLSKRIPNYRFIIKPLGFHELETMAESGKADFILTNTSHYILLENKFRVTRIATLIRSDQGSPLKEFGGVIVTRANRTDINDIKDLRNKRVVAVDTQSLGGYQVQAMELEKRGLRIPDQVELSISGMPHDNAIQALMQGKADAAFIRTGVLESLARENKLRLQDFKVLNSRSAPGFPLLHSTELYPEWPFAATRNVPESLANKVVVALLELSHESDVSRSGRYHGWSIPADYQIVHDLLRTLRLPPYDTIPEFELRDVITKYKYQSAIFGVLAGVLIALSATLFTLNRRIRERSLQLEQEAEARQKAESILATKNHILALLTQGESLPTILQHLAHLAEAQQQGCLCSILTLDEENRLRLGAAPSLPDFYNKAIDGLKIGPSVGSCGAAAFTGQRVVVEDIQAHPNWEPYRDLAARAGLRSCWSEPIFGHGKVLGTFALYSQAVHIPSASETSFFEGLAALASIAIEFKQAQDNILLQASVFDNSLEGISITDSDNCIVRVNPAFSEITGYSAEEVLGKNPRFLSSGLQSKEFYQDMWKSIHETGHWHGEVWNRKKDGEFYAEILNVSALRNQQGEITHYIGIFADISDIKQAQQQLESLAHFDPLTQLPNRFLLADRLNQAIAGANREDLLLAIGFMDLDGFKPINDTYGHETGDKLLIDVARRLNGAVRAGDTVARLGGDEFVLLLTNFNEMGEIDPVITRILGAIAMPFFIEEHELHVTASLGITMFPIDNADPDALLRHADLAMYQAKQAGRNRFHLFDPELDQEAQNRHQQLERIRQALQQDEFRLHYQPKINLRTGVVVGMEALLRWQHPERGLLPPLDFLPLTEQSDLIVSIGEWVADEALRQLAEWQQAGQEIPVSINVAGRQLQQPNFVDRLDVILARYPEVSSSLLELEILETAALEIMQTAETVINACNRLGVSFALDDFGTGYSSLAYLKQLPARTLKIDQTFVRDMLDDPEDLAIVEGVVSLASVFRRQVVAEGVETPEHGVLLMQINCDIAQGYGIAHPMPPEQIPGWIASYQPDPSWKLWGSKRWNHADLPMLLATHDHIRWVNEIIRSIEQDTVTKLRPHEVTDPHLCRFGKWYDSYGLNRYQTLPEYADIAPIHQEVHRLGAEMLELKKEGKIAQARELVPQLLELKKHVVHKLDQLQHVIATGL